MTLTQTLIDHFSNQSKTYKDNFFHFSHGNRNWEIGLAYSFDRAAQTLDGVVQYLQHPTFDFAAITTFALKDVLNARRAYTLIQKTFEYDDYLDEPREHIAGWPSDIAELSLAEKTAIVRRAKQDAEADIKIIGLRAFQRATRKYHEWGETFVPQGGSSPVYLSDVGVADALIHNQFPTKPGSFEHGLELGAAVAGLGAAIALTVYGVVTPPKTDQHHNYTGDVPAIVLPRP